MNYLGIDIGTMFVVGARPDDGQGVKISKVRDCFILIKGNPFNRKTYTVNSKVHWMPWENGDIALIGDAALDYANSAPMALEVRRPLASGILNKKEKDAYPMLRAIVESVAGSAKEGVCTLSMPAPTVDVEYLVDHHKSVLIQILNELGWKVELIHEGYCVVLSALAESDFTGIGVSFGGGMVNVSFSFLADELFAFSMQKAGDWVDQVAAESSRFSKAELTVMKETSFSLEHNNIGQDGLWQIESAYVSLINATVENICIAFDMLEKKPRVSRPIQVAIAGGTAMVPGFADRFAKALEASRFPVPVSKVFLVEDPLFAVAKGALLHARSSENSPVVEKTVPDNPVPAPVKTEPSISAAPAPPETPVTPVAKLPDLPESFRPVKK